MAENVSVVQLGREVDKEKVRELAFKSAESANESGFRRINFTSLSSELRRKGRAQKFHFKQEIIDTKRKIKETKILLKEEKFKRKQERRWEPKKKQNNNNNNINYNNNNLQQQQVQNSKVDEKEERKQNGAEQEEEPEDMDISNDISNDDMSADDDEQQNNNNNNSSDNNNSNNNNLQQQQQQQVQQQQPKSVDELYNYLNELKQQLRELKTRDKQSKMEYAQLRRNVKAEVRILRKSTIKEDGKDNFYNYDNNYNNNGGRKEGGEGEISTMAKEDPWKTRLPYMQKLFFTHHDKIRVTVFKQVSEILSAGPPGPEILENLRNFMDKIMEEAAVQPHVIDVPPMEATVRAISQKPNITKFLNSFLSSPTHFTECISDSYHHDLFDKTVLFSGKKTPWKLRMHVFLPDSFTIAQEEIHSHRNHFVSYCLYGGLSQELWELPQDVQQQQQKKKRKGKKNSNDNSNDNSSNNNNSNNSSNNSSNVNSDFEDETTTAMTTANTELPSFDLYKYIYDPTVTNDGTNTRVFNINYAGKLTLTRVQEQAVTKGQSYYMHPSVLHSVCAIDGCSVTLVWNSPLATQKSCFATHTPWQAESFVRQKFTEEEMRKQLQMVLKLLEDDQ